MIVLVTVAATPVSALTLQRTWWANNSTGGRITLRAYTTGTGSIQYSLSGMRPSSTYKVYIRYGSCARLGAVAKQLPATYSTAAGTVSRGTYLSAAKMSYIWYAARKSAISIQLVSGTSVRCAGLNYVHATRVAVPALGIDLPVIRGTSGYPPCRVALFLAAVAQPREPGITYIFAHARTGMFLPLLTRWKADHGASMIGRTIQVWTSDSYVVTYRITKFRVTLYATRGATSVTYERLWLQTSTGPNTSYPKLIVEAARVSSVKTTYAASHPAAHPISC
jgi:hypothetical protein